MKSNATNRLLLRPIKLSDASSFLRYLPEVDQFLSLIAPKNIHESNDLLQKYLNEEQFNTAVRFIIEDKNTNEFVGVVGVYNLDTDWPERHCWIRKDMQGNGYAFEAVNAFMQWANENLNYTVIYSSFDIRNELMKKLNEKLGGIKGNEEPEFVLQESGKVLNILYYSYKKPLKEAS